jgi:Skp family chaperone for outer membrane proteins
MKLTVVMASVSLASFLSAAPKFGVVRVTDIYRGLPSTAAMQADIQSQRDNIIKDVRAERLRAILTEMEALESQLRANKDDLESELGKKLVRSYEIKRQETDPLRLEFEGFRAEEEMRNNKELVAATRNSLTRMSAAAQQIAKERNLDGVMDTSGDTNTGLPFVLFAGGAEDMTEAVIGLLGEKPAENPPVGTEPVPAPAPKKPE